MKMTKIVSLILAFILVLGITTLTGCSSDKEKILIYTSVEDYVLEDMQEALDEKFPDYDITIEYLSTGDHAAKLLAEGKNTDCDITYDLEYPYITKIDAAGHLADVSSLVDTSVFEDDTVFSDNFVPQARVGGAIILNTEILEDKGLEEPKSYEDLLKPEYKNLISMPNPKSSGTGYMFLLSLVNAWGEEKAFEYFDKLSENVLSFTSSGSGPINALLQGEVAVALGMTGQAVVKINDDQAPFKIVYFEEGSPYNMYGQGIIAGKEQRACVTEVFKYLATEYIDRVCSKFFPEKLLKDKDFKVDNHPVDIVYSDMKDNTPETKERLLAKWKY